MLKKYLFFIVILALGLIFVAPVLAQNVGSPYGLDDTAQRLGYDTVSSADSNWTEIVGRGISAVLSVVTVIFFAMMIYAGIRWLTARGNDEISGKAKNALIAAISGLIVVTSSWAITNLVVTNLETVQKVAGGSCCCASLVAMDSSAHFKTEKKCVTFGETDDVCQARKVCATPNDPEKNSDGVQVCTHNSDIVSAKTQLADTCK